MRVILSTLIFSSLGCADIHDNNVQAEVSIDFCEAIDTVESKEPIDQKSDDPNALIPEWGDCEFNEDCSTNLCMCYRCIDITKFVGIGLE